MGVLPCPLSHSASLAASVVLPEPCRPASMITVGGTLANRSRRSSPPRMPTSSSLTILTTCWAGFSAPETSSPLARSLTRAMNCLTTGSATSASSREMRISRAVASMSAADSRPRPRREEKTCVRRSDRVSNTRPRLPNGLRYPRPVGPMPRPGPRHPWSIAPWLIALWLITQRGQDRVRDRAAQFGVGQRLAVTVGHVEHVDHLPPERLHPPPAHAQPPLPQRPADPPEQAGSVLGPHLHHGRGLGRVVDHAHLGRGTIRGARPDRTRAALVPVLDRQPPLNHPAQVRGHQGGVGRVAELRLR